MTYELNETFVRRLSDKACIPLDPANRDYAEYLEWVAKGNTPSQPPPPTPEQIEAEIRRAEREVLKQEIVIDQVFDQLKRATPDQINTFVNNTFGNLNAQQRMVIKMLVHVAAITVREMADE